MLTKKILKSILNVKHTAIDGMEKSCPMGRSRLWRIPPKAHNVVAVSAEGRASYYDQGRGSRSWRTCDWNKHKVYIIADAPRVYCKKHGVVTAAVP